MRIHRTFRSYKIRMYICLILTLLSLLLIHPEIRRRVIYFVTDAYNDDPNAGNRTLFLTVNHDVGRVGNKMFKYAALIGLAKRHGRRPFVFPYTKEVDMEDLFNLTNVEHHTEYDADSWTIMDENEYAYFDPVFKKLPRRDLVLRGYLQSWKYFENVENQLRQEFSLSNRMKSEADRILNEIRSVYSGNEEIVFVGVHVRRRDQLSTRKTCVSPKSFFINAFEKMRSLLPKRRLVFVVAGNDLTWCETNLSGKDVIVLKSAAPSIHFAVLASCSHFVLSIGTFGWWAGWLTGGYVIYYQKFPLPESHEAIGFHREDYYPTSWIPVDD